MILFGKHILGAFLSGEPWEVEAAMEVAYRYLVIMSLCLPSLYVLYVARSSLQGLGNTALPLASGIVEFIMRAAAAFLLPLAVGDDGIFYAEVLAWIGADLVLVPGYFLTIRKYSQKSC